MGSSAPVRLRQVCAVLQAVLDVVAAQGLQPTPTAIFAAVMSSLDRPQTQASAEVRLHVEA
jgi:ribosomal RNA-processing protein 12